MAIKSATDMIAVLPKPTNLSFSYPKDWGAESAAGLAVSSLAELQALGAAMLSNAVGNSTHAQLSDRYGKTVNKREKVLFRSLPYRAVSFEWNLVPKSSAQAAQYLQVIDDFKFYSAPDIPGAGGHGFFEYPYTFSLELKTKKSGGRVIFRSPELACTDVVVNYTPQGFWTQHEDGMPVQISFALSFMERELAIRSNLGGVII